MRKAGNKIVFHPFVVMKDREECLSKSYYYALPLFCLFRLISNCNKGQFNPLHIEQFAGSTACYCKINEDTNNDYLKQLITFPSEIQLSCLSDLMKRLRLKQYYLNNAERKIELCQSK